MSILLLSRYPSLHLMRSTHERRRMGRGYRKNARVRTIIPGALHLMIEEHLTQRGLQRRVALILRRRGIERVRQSASVAGRERNPPPLRRADPRSRGWAGPATAPRPPTLVDSVNHRPDGAPGKWPRMRVLARLRTESCG